MEGLPAKSGDTTEKMIKEDNLEDLYKKLESQENDLVLAAELGKALLDKNEEISKDRESIVVEYLQKLEVCDHTYYRLVIRKSFLYVLGTRTGEVPPEEEDGGAGGGVPAAGGGAACRYC